MHVGMSGHGASGTLQVVNRFRELALLFENAAKVVPRDAVIPHQHQHSRDDFQHQHRRTR